MKSPLNSYASGGRGEIYVSSVGAIQQAVGAVQGAINSYVNEDASHKADRLAGRVENRKNRLSHEKTTYNKDGTVKKKGDEDTDYFQKTEKITAKAAESKLEARNNQQTEIERLKKENEAYRNKYKA